MQYESDKYSLNIEYENDFLIPYELINIEQFLQIQYPAFPCVKGYFPRDEFDDHRPSLMFDYYENETLLQYLEKKEKTDTRNYILILGIAIALKHLQSRNIIHYLLSPDVIYIDKNFYSYVSFFTDRDISQVKKYLNIFGNEFNNLKDNF